MTDASTEGDSEDEWRFSLEDLEGDTAEDSGGNIAGAFTPSEELEPGDVDLENALFVVLGVVVMLLVVAGFVVTMTP
ncbi:hypothetical protein ACKVMT_15595 [Halobacteriales archaeon Cl-PHB]